MTQTSPATSERPAWRALLLLAFARVVITATLAQRGVVALSDDDFARVTIAQRFALHPALDPSGTSWLPFPFWITGAAMKLLDPSLETARSVSTALAVAATWLLYAGGRLFGLPERLAFAAALIANLVPAAALLGCMTLPELPTAALCVFAVLAMSTPRDATASAPGEGCGVMARSASGALRLSASGALRFGASGALRRGASGAVERSASGLRGAWRRSASEALRRSASGMRGALRRIPAEVFAGVAAAAATLSRYEAWPIAAVVTTVGVVRAGRDALGSARVGRDALGVARSDDAQGDAQGDSQGDDARWGALAARFAGAVLPMVGVMGWMLHNRWAHGDALSFLHRVASYRAALGAPAGASMAAYVSALVGGCPAVALACAMLVFLVRRQDRQAFALIASQLLIVSVGAAAVVAFLVIGAAVGGAPTHHPERALLVVWILAVFACARILSLYRPPQWWWMPVALLLVLDFRQQVADVGHPRPREELVGLQLRALVLPGERVVVSTRDYGYFAVLAAFARPLDVILDKTHDPRAPTEDSLLGDRWGAPARLAAVGATWLVAPTSSLFPSALSERARSGELAIFELAPARSR